jgi:hypothetical protein
MQCNDGGVSHVSLPLGVMSRKFARAGPESATEFILRGNSYSRAQVVPVRLNMLATISTIIVY